MSLSWFCDTGKLSTTKVWIWSRPSPTWEARSSYPAANWSTTSVMIPATTPSPTSSISVAAPPRGQPCRTRNAAPGCRRAASSRATMTGTTTTATEAAPSSSRYSAAPTAIVRQDQAAAIRSPLGTSPAASRGSSGASRDPRLRSRPAAGGCAPGVGGPLTPPGESASGASGCGLPAGWASSASAGSPVRGGTPAAPAAPPRARVAPSPVLPAAASSAAVTTCSTTARRPSSSSRTVPSGNACGSCSRAVRMRSRARSVRWRARFNTVDLEGAGPGGAVVGRVWCGARLAVREDGSVLLRHDRVPA